MQPSSFLKDYRGILVRLLQEADIPDLPADFEEVLSKPVEDFVPDDIKLKIQAQKKTATKSLESTKPAPEPVTNPTARPEIVGPMSYSGHNAEYDVLVATNKPSTIIYDQSGTVVGVVSFGEEIPGKYKSIYNSKGQLLAKRKDDDTGWIAGQSPAKASDQKGSSKKEASPIPDYLPFGLTPKPKDWGLNLEGTPFNIGNLYSYKPGGYPDVMLVGPAPTIGDLLVRVYSKSETQDPVGSGIGRKLTKEEIVGLRNGEWSIPDTVLSVKNIGIENTPSQFFDFVKSPEGLKQSRQDPDLAYSRFRLFVIEDPQQLAVPVKSATPEGREAAARGECALSASQVVDHTWSWMSEEAWDFDKQSDSLDRLVPCVRGTVDSIPYAVVVLGASAIFKNPKILQYSYAVPYMFFSVYYASRGMWKTAASCLLLAAVLAMPQLAAEGALADTAFAISAGALRFSISRAALTNSVAVLLQMAQFSVTKDVTEEEYKQKVRVAAEEVLDSVYKDSSALEKSMLIETLESSMTPDVIQKINTLHPPM